MTELKRLVELGDPWAMLPDGRAEKIRAAAVAALPARAARRRRFQRAVVVGIIASTAFAGAVGLPYVLPATHPGGLATAGADAARPASGRREETPSSAVLNEPGVELETERLATQAAVSAAFGAVHSVSGCARSPALRATHPAQLPRETVLAAEANPAQAVEVRPRPPSPDPRSLNPLFQSVPVRSPTESDCFNLAAESELLTRVLRHVKQADPAGALELLDEYEQRFSCGVLSEEAEGLRSQARIEAYRPPEAAP